MKITKEQLKNLIKEQARKLLEIDIIDKYDDEDENEDDSNDFEDDDVDGLEGLEKSDDELANQEDLQADLEVPTMSNLENYQELSSVLKSLSEKIGERKTNVLNSEIKSILESGRGKHTNENSYGKTSLMDELNYITTTLATIYKEVDESEKKNIINYLFAAFSPFASSGLPSQWLKNIAINSKINNDFRFIRTSGIDKKTDLYIGIISDAIYSSIPKSLENYNPKFGFKFNNFLFSNCINETKSSLKSTKNQNAFNTGSIDRPLDAEEGDDTLSDRLTEPVMLSAAQQEFIESVKGAIVEFITKKLEYDEKENDLEFFNLFFVQGLTLEQVTEITGKNAKAIQSIQNRLANYINDNYVSNGQLQKFVRQTTGHVITFPGNKFSLSSKTVKDKETGDIVNLKSRKENKQNKSDMGAGFIGENPKGEEEYPWLGPDSSNINDEEEEEIENKNDEALNETDSIFDLENNGKPLDPRFELQDTRRDNDFGGNALNEIKKLIRKTLES